MKKIHPWRLTYKKQSEDKSTADYAAFMSQPKKRISRSRKLKPKVEYQPF